MAVVDGASSVRPSRPDSVLVGTAGPPSDITLPYLVVVASLTIDGGTSIPPPFRPQKATQKSKSFSITSPRSSTHPSNHSSQLTLQLGNQALSRSIRMNLGCMTENGRTKMLFTTMSNPSSSSGAGKPNLDHDSVE